MQTTSSKANVLLRNTHERGIASFAFFTRRVLGLRRLNETRLNEIQAGAVPKSDNERFALRKWREFAGSCPSELPIWLFGGTLSRSGESVGA